jgi:hypothetical protein
MIRRDRRFRIGDRARTQDGLDVQIVDFMGHKSLCLYLDGVGNVCLSSEITTDLMTYVEWVIATERAKRLIRFMAA